MEVSQEVSSMVRGWLRASPSASKCRLSTTCALITPRPERLGLGAMPPSEEVSNKSTLTSKIGKKLMKRRRRHDDWEEQEEDHQAQLSRATNASDEECSRSTAIISAKRRAERHPGVMASLGRTRRKRKKRKPQKEEEVSSSSAVFGAILDPNDSNQSSETLRTHADAVELSSSILGARATIAGEDPSKHGGSRIETAGWAAQETLPRTKDLLLGGSKKLKKKRLEHVKRKSKGKERYRKTELEQSLTDRTHATGRVAEVTELTESLIPAVESRPLTELSETGKRGEMIMGGTGACHKRKKRLAKADRPQHEHSLDVEMSHNVANNTDVCLNCTQPSTSEPQSTSTEPVVLSRRSGKRTVGHKMKHSKLLRRQRKLKSLRRAFQENIS